MFIRIYRRRGKKEIYLNVDHVSKIEIEYNFQGKDGDFWLTSPHEGAKNPEAVRWYKVFVAGEEFLLVANPDDPVLKVFEEIVKNSIKGIDKPPEPGAPADEGRM